MSADDPSVTNRTGWEWTSDGTVVPWQKEMLLCLTDTGRGAAVQRRGRV